MTAPLNLQSSMMKNHYFDFVFGDVLYRSELRGVLRGRNEFVFERGTLTTMTVALVRHALATRYAIDKSMGEGEGRLMLLYVLRSCKLWGSVIVKYPLIPSYPLILQVTLLFCFL